MDDLITRLEAATEGDSGLDYEIHEALGWQDNDECGWSRDGVSSYPDTGWPSYTRSLDAALTLVPEGWRRQVFEIGNGKWDARLIRRGDSECVTSIYAATGPLALCIAALKARNIHPKQK